MFHFFVFIFLSSLSSVLIFINDISCLTIKCFISARDGFDHKRIFFNFSPLQASSEIVK